MSVAENNTLTTLVPRETNRALAQTSDGIVLTEEFKTAPALLQADFAIRPVIFVTGPAGTGKTTLLRYYVNHFAAQETVVLAPTGIAALNVGGQTIHSFFRLKPGNLLDLDALQPIPKRVVNHFNTLIVDEASMLRADLFDAMDRILRISTGSDIPFGGKKVILFGDLFQLPPVEENQESGLAELFAQRYASPYFFEARVLREIPLQMFELKRIFRQQQDVNFIRLLNRIREGHISQAELDASLNTRITSRKPEEIENSIILAPTNQSVTWRNHRYLAGLKTEEFVYHAKVEKDFTRILPADEELHLKAGAKIMMLANDSDKRWVNGDIGYVHELGDDFVRVQLRGSVYDVQPYVWEQIRYEYNPLTQRLEKKVKGTFTQYPLKLAWAITIHKSQGMTFDNVYLDMGRGAFATGQTYVALSRCRSLNGVHLQREIEVKDVLCDKRVQNFLRAVQGSQIV